MTELLEPIAPNLLRWEADQRITLLAGRRADGQIVFPMPSGDSTCEEIQLPREGTLWSWTVQRFRPKSPPYVGPEAFEPYAVGYVDLGDVIVESRLIGPWEALRIGMPMSLVAEPFALAAGGTRMTFAFEQAGGSA